MLKKFSIILPVRNGGELVKRCIQSILSQTNQNFDLLILDNCSIDGTSEWLQSLDNEKIKIFPSTRPLTIEENWSRIKDIPKNEFITLIGHDDLLHADYLEEMSNLIEFYPNASLYQTHFKFINAEGALVKLCRRMLKKYIQPAYLEAILEDKLDSTGTGYMMRAADYDQLSGIPPYPNLLFADHALWIQLTGLSFMAVSEKECFSYRLNQSTSKLSGASKYIDAFYMFLDFLSILEKKNEHLKEIIREHVPGYIQFYCTSLTHRLLKTPVNQRDGKTVASFILNCKQKADILSPGNHFQPLDQFSIRLSKLIDNNLFLQHCYLSFKKIYKKSFYP
ncbi:glycosyltransferase family 2 protein [Terrimonas sp.]|uniref:glycosyltransferase family 2 protein n=1 Tax=Terrimonas sp. TaxID=1914338 RepID=UPI0014036BED|nr:glycosyltransferase family 2 protein [Terrimonas sp.]